MRAPDSLFTYRPLSTAIHRAPAAVKLVALGLATGLAFGFTALPLAVLTGILLTLSAAACIPVSTHLRNLRILFWYGVMILAFRLVGHELTVNALRPVVSATADYLWRLALVLAAGSLFYETTSSLEIRHTLSAVRRAVCRIPGGSSLPDIGYLLSLTICFIPRIFHTWSALCQAWDARGGSLHRGLRGTWAKTSILLPLLVSSLLSAAADTEKAVRSRSV